ncbi:ribosomal-protein-alanine acetyltransferase [Jannaschia seosinensis]|uniref:Ribosomal-protein-alanine acetyltransferase n=1 Tax=Jannaschia seosinensis TaxID=313367 RepID=A0A0M7B695_9RHOB|nr:GNAT family N-acetyltransferase [Jannaschia seosinensis]CUH33787.1 ribosomal-protein-alanine acetyltransferase [Jannaschia seosinensis]
MIRLATPEDRDAITALHLASWQDSYAGILPPEYLRDGLAGDLAAKWAARTFAPPELTLVAFTGKEMTGFVCALTGREPPLIDNLHVRPDLRAGGTGGKLLEAMKVVLREGGFARACLTVLEENAAAHRFYLRHGGVDEGSVADEIVGFPVASRRIGFDLR